MASFEKHWCERSLHNNEEEDYGENSEESDTDMYYSDDDSQEDPTFDIVGEETRASFLNLSIKKKPPKSRIFKGTDEEDADGEPDVVIEEVSLPELDEKDQKSYEVIQKLIQVGGQVEKLKVDQCKVYLRKHGLRLTGNKDTLIKRIKEHLEILNGGGEMKYPVSSFVFNCKGDACTGDVVMFEQNVYEMFNIASRSANGPPCGTRVVAGRVVKESYGAAKQQHTFTIEVLWSKGEKQLPPLHPLLIKGRNLYRLKTMRQRWQDEGERQKILMEKHARGSLARSNREARIQEKEMRRMPKANRVSRMKDQCRNPKENNLNKGQTFQTAPENSQKLGGRQPQEKQKDTVGNIHQGQNFQQKEYWNSKIWKNNTSAPPEALCKRPSFFPNVNVPSEYQRQPLTSLNSNFNPSKLMGFHVEHSWNCNSLRNGHDERIKGCPARSPFRGHAYEESKNFNRASSPFHRQGVHKQRQLCRYYAQGRCFYGEQCKYLHECG